MLKIKFILFLFLVIVHIVPPPPVSHTRFVTSKVWLCLRLVCVWLLGNLRVWCNAGWCNA